MNEMVERVARAIVDECMKFEGGDSDVLDSRNLARVAIAAMREPTGEMMDADEMCPINKHDARVAWHAMIDEALK